MLSWRIFEGSQTDGPGAAALIIFSTWSYGPDMRGRWDMGVTDRGRGHKGQAKIETDGSSPTSNERPKS